MTRAQAVQKLRALRDRARRQAHLFSMAARERWGDLEDELAAFEYRVQQASEETAATWGERLSDLAGRVNTFLERNALGSLTLVSPAERAMTEKPVSCLPSDSVNAAARIMWEQDCGVVPVVSKAGTLVGMLTDRDLSMGCYTQGKPPQEVTVDSVMSRQLHAVRPSAPLSEVMSLVRAHRVRRVPVTTPDGHLLGIVSLADLLRHLPEQREPSEFEATLVETLVSISGRRQPAAAAKAAAAE